MTTPAQNVVRTSWNVTNQTNIRKELQMDNQKSCRCLEIIDERLNEISRKNEIYRKTTPSETIDENDFYKIQDVLKIFEKDFYEIQALLKIYNKILAEKNKE